MSSLLANTWLTFFIVCTCIYLQAISLKVLDISPRYINSSMVEQYIVLKIQFIYLQLLTKQAPGVSFQWHTVITLNFRSQNIWTLLIPDHKSLPCYLMCYPAWKVRVCTTFNFVLGSDPLRYKKGLLEFWQKWQVSNGVLRFSCYYSDMDQLHVSFFMSILKLS